MDTFDLVGLGLGLFGLLLLFIAILSPKFKRYAGITEYKKIRETYTVNKREIPEPKEEVEEFETNSSPLVTAVSGLIGIIITGIIGYTVFGQVIEVIEPTLNASGVGGELSGILGGSVLPLVLGIGSLGTLLMFMFTFIRGSGMDYDYGDDEDEDEDEEPSKPKEDLGEYKNIRRTYTKNTR